MKESCVLCGRELGTFSRTTIKNGHLCHKCRHMMPCVFSDNFLKICHVNDLRRFMFNRTEIIKNAFETTSSYGKLLIDESKGYFAINESNGEAITENTAIFSIRDVEDFSIYVTDPKANKNGKVVADVEISCTFSEKFLHFSFKTKIAKNVFCHSKNIDKTHVEWDEPGELSMFRNMFNQMIRNENEKIQRMLAGYVTAEEIDRFKARQSFLLGDTYTAQDVENRKNILDKAFENEVDTLAKINYYYSLLMGEFKENE